MAEIKKINTELQLESALRDGNGSPGTNGQVLSSTGTATDWISLSEIQGVDGTGTANYISKWSDTDTITNSIIFDNGTNVGIGTTSPTKKLHVNGDAFFQNTVSLPDNAYVGLGSSFDFHLVHNGSNSSITNSTGNLNISSNGGDAVFNTSSSERMRITSSGNIGIGTTSPTKDLEIGTSAAAETEFRMHSDESGRYFNIQSAGNFTSVKTTGSQNFILDSSGSSGYVTFVTNASERMRVNYNGNVGIGTTSPTQKLHIDGNTLISAQRYYYVAGGGTGFGSDASGNFKIRQNGADLIFGSGNNVGIGTTSPGNKLTISGPSSNQFEIINSANSKSWRPNVNGTSFYITESGVSNPFVIQAGGNVGIGTTSPSEKLEVSGNSLVTGTQFIGDTFTKIQQASGNLLLTNQSLSGAIAFLTNSTEQVRITSTGNVGIGTTSPTHNLHIASDAPVIRLQDNTSSDNHYLNGNNGEFRIQTTGFLTLRPGNTESVRFLANGNVGINETNPTKKLQVNGQTKFYEYSGAHLTNQATSNFNFDTLANNTASSTGGSVGAFIKLTGTPPGATGVWSTFRARAYGENAKGNTSGMMTFFSEYRNYTSTNAVTLGYHAGLYVNPLGVGGLATVTNNYGVYLNPGTAATNNYGVYQNGSSVKNFFQGKVSIGTTTPNYPLTVVSETGNIGVAFFDSADNWERIYIGSTNDYIERKGSEQRITFAAQGSAGQFTFQTSGSEKLRITNSGNVGIGTTSPQSKLHVLGTTTLPSPGADGGAAVFGNTSSTDYGLVLGTETSGKSYIQSQRNDGTATTYALLVQPNGGNVGIGTTSPLSKLNVNGSIKIEGENQLYFGSSGSVPLWGIKALGNDLIINEQGTNSGDLIFTGQDFGVGITNPSEKLHVSGEPHPSIRLSSSSDSNYNVVINCGYRNEALNLSVGGYKVFTTEGYNTPETTHLYSNNSKALSLASNQAATFTSTVTATNFINSSDERLKENIEKVCNNSLDVQWKTFEFKSDRGQKRYGVIAQELEKTNPEFVREDAEGFKSVAYIDLLIAKIAELEERIQTLENK